MPKRANGRGAVTLKTGYLLTPREFDTVLAALRFWQARIHQPEDILEIAENGREGEDAALNADEIDDLCERLNCGG
jgi:hypothetical protein